MMFWTLILVAKIDKLRFCVAVVAKELHACDRCPLLDSLVHREEGDEWLKSQRKCLPVAML